MAPPTSAVPGRPSGHVAGYSAPSARLQPAGAKRALQRVTMTHLVFWTCLGLAILAVALPPLRYLLYLAPILVLIGLLADDRLTIGDEIRPYAVFVVAGLALSPMANRDGLLDIYLACTGAAVALLPLARPVRPAMLLLLYTVGMGLYFGLVGVRGDLSDFSVTDSSSPLESNFGFLFPVIAIYALIKRDWFTFFVALILAVATLKRIALVGLALVVILYFLRDLGARRLLTPLVMIAVNVALVGLFVAYGNGQFDDAIHSLTGQSANQLGVGRRALLELPARTILDEPWRFLAIGAGPGSTYELATEGTLAIATKANLHSDLIKLVYEYGLLVFIAFIWALYSAKSFEVRLFALYCNVLYVTDNSLIYGFFIVLVVVCARFSTQDADRPRAIRFFESRSMKRIDAPAAGPKGSSRNRAFR